MLLKMDKNLKMLLEESNVISLRTAVIIDDGNLVDFRLMPAWLESSMPRSATKSCEWVLSNYTYLYRHLRSASEEAALCKRAICTEQEVKPIDFVAPPRFALVWADSGNTVGLFLNG